MRCDLKDLIKRTGNTTVYVTHDQLEAITIADRIVVMNFGVVQQIGTPLDIYEKPENKFVATFIGEPAMNLIQGKLQKVDNNALFIKGTQQIVLSGLALHDELFNEATVSLGVRPNECNFSLGRRKAG